MIAAAKNSLLFELFSVLFDLLSAKFVEISSVSSVTSWRNLLYNPGEMLRFWRQNLWNSITYFTVWNSFYCLSEMSRTVCCCLVSVGQIHCLPNVSYCLTSDSYCLIWHHWAAIRLSQTPERHLLRKAQSCFSKKRWAGNKVANPGPSIQIGTKQLLKITFPCYSEEVP